MIRTISALAAVALATLMAAAGLVLDASPAYAASTPGVIASCSTLEVKPKGFTAKGEVRVTVDGEIQTEGTSDGWRSFSTSFTQVYRFEPTAAHEYSVEINSFDGESDGRGFTPGRGADADFSGPTVPCGGVEVLATASNCVSATALNKQSVNLTLGNLRRSTTYLVEVLRDGDVLKHFQFRTSPVTSKTFSGLTAGVDYQVRVTDQSDGALSSATDIAIPGCAGDIDLLDTRSVCIAGSPSFEVALDGLVSGREYDVHFRASVRQLETRAFTAPAGRTGLVLRFAGLVPGGYAMTVSDAAAPRSVSRGVTVSECASDVPAAPAAPGTSVPGSDETGSGAGAPDSTVPDLTVPDSTSLGGAAVLTADDSTATARFSELGTLAFPGGGAAPTLLRDDSSDASGIPTVDDSSSASTPVVPRTVSSAVGLGIAVLIGAMLVGSLALRALRARRSPTP